MRGDEDRIAASPDPAHPPGTAAGPIDAGYRTGEKQTCLFHYKENISQPVSPSDARSILVSIKPNTCKHATAVLFRYIYCILYTLIYSYYLLHPLRDFTRLATGTWDESGEPFPW